MRQMLYYVHLQLYAPWKIFRLFCRLQIFFSKSTFSGKKFRNRIRSECQTFWTQISIDILTGLDWVQMVRKSYQQTTLGDKELNNFLFSLTT